MNYSVKKVGIKKKGLNFSWFFRAVLKDGHKHGSVSNNFGNCCGPAGRVRVVVYRTRRRRSRMVHSGCNTSRCDQETRHNKEYFFSLVLHLMSCKVFYLQLGSRDILCMESFIVILMKQEAEITNQTVCESTNDYCFHRQVFVWLTVCYHQMKLILSQHPSVKKYSLKNHLASTNLYRRPIGPTEFLPAYDWEIMVQSGKFGEKEERCTNVCNECPNGTWAYVRCYLV